MIILLVQPFACLFVLIVAFMIVVWTFFVYFSLILKRIIVKAIKNLTILVLKEEAVSLSTGLNEI